MGKPKQISNFIEISHREINIYLKRDVLHRIKENQLEILLEGYGRYTIEFEEM